jgi:hypothetical protein
MAMEEDLRVGFEVLRGRSKARMLNLQVGFLREVIWCHPHLLSSPGCLKMNVDIVGAVCRQVPAQE